MTVNLANLDEAKFFAGLRNGPFPGRLTTDNVTGIQDILAEAATRALPNLWYLAYPLATAFHETNHIMLPVIETRRADEAQNPSVDIAIGRLERSWQAGHMPWVKTPYWRKNVRGLSYLGRGLPQLTHETNYQRMGDLLAVDLVGNPDLALDPLIASKIMFEGMIRGVFTGHKLADYFSDPAHPDPKGARRIINGQERADLVAGYAWQFEQDLRAAMVTLKIVS
jgi:hypothetical protein